MAEGLIGGEGFAVDASLIKADANRQCGVPHVPVFDKSQRTDGTFSRDDFSYDQEKGHQPCCTNIFIPADHSANLVGSGRDNARLRDAPFSRSLKTASMMLSPLFCQADKTLQNVTAMGIREDTNPSHHSHCNARIRRRLASHPGRCGSGSLCYSHHSQAWRRPS